MVSILLSGYSLHVLGSTVERAVNEPTLGRWLNERQTVDRRRDYKMPLRLSDAERQQDSIVACAYEAFTDAPRMSKY
jgi:hypothetical protein